MMEQKALLINTYREKEINALLFFLDAGTKYPTLMKLYKLLYYFDFNMIKATGKQPTRLTYKAYEFGPVPFELEKELLANSSDYKYGIPQDFTPYIKIKVNKSGIDEHTAYYFEALKKPDMDVFSPREIKELNDIHFWSKDMTPSDMSKASHESDAPWRITKNRFGLKSVIDPILALNKGSSIKPEFFEFNLNERKESIESFGLKPYLV